MKFREYLKEHKIVTDGAMGTYYAKLEKNEGAISEYGNFESPEKIERIHKEYIQAGARLIRTNTFVANTKALDITKEQQSRMIQVACDCAKRAVSSQKETIYIAGSIGPISEDAGTNEQEIMQEYQRICDLLLEQEVDVLLFETFSDLTYLKQLVPYIRKKSDVFIQVNFCVNKNGYSRVGISAKRLLEEVAQVEEIDGCGLNCGVGSGHMLQLLKQITIPENKYFAVIPNAGYPEQLQNRMVFLDNANYFVENMKIITELGPDMIGGCCGTTPTYIRKMVQAIEFREQQKRVKSQVVETQAPSRKVKPNSFIQKFERGKKVVAVELDPPYDSNYERVIECAHSLKHCGVDMITIADSPMGRSRVDSVLMSIKIAKETEMPVMPHVCCRDKNMIAMRSGILGAYINEIRNFLFVTGDPVPSVNRIHTSSVFDYNSIQLMNFVNEMNEEHFQEDPICYGGALNYGRGRIEAIIERMERKIEAGASYFLTQPVYSKEDMERLRFIRKKVDTKLMIGIMPFVSYRNANFVKNEMTGIFVPDEVVERYHMDMTKEEAEEVGVTLANELIRKSYDFADGYYFILPFNRVSMMEKIRIEG